MKKYLCLCLCLLFILMAGCSPEIENNELDVDIDSPVEIYDNEDVVPDKEQNTPQSSKEGINILEAMDITNIIKLIPLNDNEIYIIGAKKDDSFEQREIVYGVLSLEDKKTEVFHREFTSIDGAHNAAVQMNNDGLTEFFTGQKILILDGYNLIDSKPIAIEKKESFVDLKQKKIVAIEHEDLVLYLRSFDEEQIVIYKPEEYMDEKGKEHILFPFSPRIYEDRIIYGIAEDDTMRYKKIIVSDFTGNVLCEMDELENRSDNIFFYFKESDFVTIETSDYLPDGTEKEMTFFTEYNSKGEIISEKVVSGIYLDGQGKMYDGCALYAYAFKNGSDFGVAIYDFYDETAYQIEIVEGYVISPTITPSGNKVIWANNGSVFFEDINNIKSNTIIENIK